jgi:hypothetical protein
MADYTLIKIDDGYVVQVGGQCILKLSSRRRAAQLISEALGLLNADAAAEARGDATEEPSTPREVPEVP